MKNKIKKNTIETIKKLQKSNIRTVMVTGDNILTSISVARQINLVNPNQRIYYGDLSEEKINGKYNLIWKDFDFYENSLNPFTLEPDDQKELSERELVPKNYFEIEESNKDHSNSFSQPELGELNFNKYNRPVIIEKSNDIKYT